MFINSVCFPQKFSSGHLKFSVLCISAKTMFAVKVKHKRFMIISIVRAN